MIFTKKNSRNDTNLHLSKTTRSINTTQILGKKIVYRTELCEDHF